jgi:hypothetical protein
MFVFNDRIPTRLIFDTEKDGQRQFSRRSFEIAAEHSQKLLIPHVDGETEGQEPVLLVRGVITMNETQIRQAIASLQSKLKIRPKPPGISSDLPMTQPWPATIGGWRKSGTTVHISVMSHR